MNELIYSNPKNQHFFKIDLQEYFPALICLSEQVLTEDCLIVWKYATEDVTNDCRGAWQWL
jgi:hypothetical protein